MVFFDISYIWASEQAYYHPLLLNIVLFFYFTNDLKSLVVFFSDKVGDACEGWVFAL